VRTRRLGPSAWLPITANRAHGMRGAPFCLQGILHVAVGAVDINRSRFSLGKCVVRHTEKALT
jgi:hypothetical protein